MVTKLILTGIVVLGLGAGITYAICMSCPAM